MIVLDESLCGGCGVCVEACPTGAVTLVNDIPLVDAERCDGCAECVDVCPNQALAWIHEPVLEASAEPSSLVVIQSPGGRIQRAITAPVPWRRALFPVVGGALSWAGRELVPRLAPMALDALEGALDRRLSRRSQSDRARPSVSGVARGKGRGRRHRRRRGHLQE
jgi:NAD-dependent dihydropyrimidine dehydrogenase PreA subunit